MSTATDGNPATPPATAPDAKSAEVLALVHSFRLPGFVAPERKEK